MALFTILRNVGDVTRDDIDADALRAIVCAYEFPGLRWLHSYWDRPAGHLLCLYEAKDTAEIEEHARRSRIPCDEVHEVTILGPADYEHLAFVDAPAAQAAATSAAQ